MVTYSQRALKRLTSFLLIMNSIINFLSAGVAFSSSPFLFHFAAQPLPTGLGLCSFSLTAQQTELTHRVQNNPERFEPVGSATAWPPTSSLGASRSGEQSRSCTMLSHARKSEGLACVGEIIPFSQERCCFSGACFLQIEVCVWLYCHRRHCEGYSPWK